LREAISFMTPIVVALIIAIFLKTCIFANIVIPTGSMLNTIQEGDRIIASRLAYINDEPQRYDIIIFRYPDDETQLFAKRIIALPGETIEVKNGIVYITDKNGNKSTARTDFITNCVPTGNFGPYTVPLGSYFVMGDNRNDSWDSRYWDNKTVKKEKIIGKVKFRYFPNPGKIE
jgi:signal peptidase I